MLTKTAAKDNQIKCDLPPFSCSVLLELFPFAVLLDPTLTIIGVGEKLVEVSGGKEKLLGQLFTKYFKLRAPKGISLTWNNVSGIYYFKIKLVIFVLELCCLLVYRY